MVCEQHCTGWDEILIWFYSIYMGSKTKTQCRGETPRQQTLGKLQGAGCLVCGREQKKKSQNIETLEGLILQALSCTSEALDMGLYFVRFISSCNKAVTMTIVIVVVAVVGVATLH
jgi:hypothetical protein